MRVFTAIVLVASFASAQFNLDMNKVEWGTVSRTKEGWPCKIYHFTNGDIAVITDFNNGTLREVTKDKNGKLISQSWQKKQIEALPLTDSRATGPVNVTNSDGAVRQLVSDEVGNVNSTIVGLAGNSMVENSPDVANATSTTTGNASVPTNKPDYQSKETQPTRAPPAPTDNKVTSSAFKTAMGLALSGTMAIFAFAL